MNSALDPGPMPELLTRCKHCDKPAGIFRPPVPVIGQPTDAAYFEMVSRMCQHLTQRHQKVFNEALGRQMPAQIRFSHLFYTGEFTSNDPEFHKYCDVTRHSFLRMFQRRVTDQKLIARVNSLETIRWGEGPEEGGTVLVKLSDVLDLFKQMRDVIQEEGLYPEIEQAAQNRIILASKTGL